MIILPNAGVISTSSCGISLFLPCLQHSLTDLEYIEARPYREAANLQLQLNRIEAVRSAVNGGYYLGKTEPQHLFLCNTQYFLHTFKSVLNNKSFLFLKKN